MDELLIVLLFIILCFIGFVLFLAFGFMCSLLILFLTKIPSVILDMIRGGD